MQSMRLRIQSRTVLTRSVDPTGRDEQVADARRLFHADERLGETVIILAKPPIRCKKIFPP